MKLLIMQDLFFCHGKKVYKFVGFQLSNSFIPLQL